MMYVKVFVECKVVYNVDFIGLCDLKEFLIYNIIYIFFFDQICILQNTTDSQLWMLFNFWFCYIFTKYC